MDESLEKFGKIIIENLRDKQIDFYRGLLTEKWKAEDLKDLQKKLKTIDKKDKETINDLVDELLTHAIHDLLFAIQENHDLENGLEILVDNKNVAELSDGLHGEIFSDDGWIQKFSKYKSDKETERSNWAKNMIDKMFGNEKE